MDASQLWFTVLAVVASVLSTGGIISQFIAWRREREKVNAEERMKQAVVAVELAKVGLDSDKNEREHTGRFQLQLMDRIALLESKQDTNANELVKLQIANEKCEENGAKLLSKYESLLKNYKIISEQNRVLAHEHDQLKADHVQLNEHVARISRENFALRYLLGLEEFDVVPIPPSLVASETTEIGARDDRQNNNQGD